jgi:hypothetical protein
MEMQGHRGDYRQDAKRIDPEKSPYVEVFQESSAGEAAALHRIHQHQRSMNKEKEHAEYSNIVESARLIVPGQVVEQHH